MIIFFIGKFYFQTLVEANCFFRSNRVAEPGSILFIKAKFVFWFDEQDTSWFSYSVASEKTVRLNESLKIKFADEEDDHPDYPNGYGAAGWTKDDNLFLAYDRYDIWAFDPENKKAPVNLTKIGR